MTTVDPQSPRPPRLAVVGVIVAGGRDERLRLNRFDDVRRAQSRRIVLSEEVL